MSSIPIVSVCRTCGASFTESDQCFSCEKDGMGIHAVEVTALLTEIAELKKALGELVRLYDWRFELAEMEKQTDPIVQRATKALLRQYGHEKKAAWEKAREALAAL